MQKTYIVIGVIILVLVVAGGFIVLRRSAIPSTNRIAPSQDKTGVTNQPVTTTIPDGKGTSDVTSGIILNVNSPVNGATLTTPSVTVSGTTQKGADVSVNDQDLKADANGNFSAKITLDEGENFITIVANDANGNFAEKEITINYEPAI